MIRRLKTAQVVIAAVTRTRLRITPAVILPPQGCFQAAVEAALATLGAAATESANIVRPSDSTTPETTVAMIASNTGVIKNYGEFVFECSLSV